jgi:pimeloyl-ACP methyl ester carboxylesterase
VFPPGEAHSSVIAEDGTRLFVRSKDGDFPPGSTRIFLSDGILCDGFIWKYLWDDLAAVAPITHWNYRGHGRSGPPSDPDRIDIAALADDLATVRRFAGDPPCVLVGHSMGCQVVLESYRRHPENVRGLILICGTFGKVTSTFRGMPILDLILPKIVEAVLKHEDLARMVWTRIPPEVALRFALKAGEVDPDKVRPEDVLPYLKHMTHVDLPMFLKMLRSAGEHTAEDLLPNIKVPTMIVAGGRDTWTPAFLAESMAQAIPGAELLLLEKGTHVVAIEQPEIVDMRILEFLRSRVLGTT